MSRTKDYYFDQIEAADALEQFEQRCEQDGPEHWVGEVKEKTNQEKVSDRL